MIPSQRATLASVALAIAAIAFVMGFRTGNSAVGSPDFAVPSVYNKEDGMPDGVDFSPFWKAWGVIEDKYAGTTTTAEDKLWGAIEGLASSLGDPYTVFFPPVESKVFASEIAGNFEGVGMEVGVKDGRLVVVSPIKDAPAERAGVKAGDFILKIGDKPSSDMPTDKAVQLIRGKAGTKVTLTLDREGADKPIEITITRAKIDLPTVKTELKGDVFVIALYSFNANSAQLFRGALKDFIDSGSHKLIIDLRGNPGGYLEASIDMASWFLPSGAVVVREEFGQEHDERLYRSKGYDIFGDALKLVLLVDGGSASASEILAGALKENGKATLVGAKTFGKGSVQELVTITPETSLKVTIAKWLTPDGNSISNNGITPDYEVEIAEEDVKAKRDPQMEKALELLAK
ncbi:MAG: S41 family peptidase [Candidatus Taylorbacteria bacterium]|nr:S41 family peptidase [Candidatus Taylorbacteria bacterium]